MHCQWGWWGAAVGLLCPRASPSAEGMGCARWLCCCHSVPADAHAGCWAETGWGPLWIALQTPSFLFETAKIRQLTLFQSTNSIAELAGSTGKLQQNPWDCLELTKGKAWVEQRLLLHTVYSSLSGEAKLLEKSWPRKASEQQVTQKEKNGVMSWSKLFVHHPHPPQKRGSKMSWTLIRQKGNLWTS